MADNALRLAGAGYIWVDGVSYPLVSDLIYSTSDVERTTLRGMDRVHGYSEVPRAGFISATLRDEAGTSLQAFRDMTNTAVSCETASGKRVQGNGMWTVDAQEVSVAEATFTVRWEGLDVRDDG